MSKFRSIVEFASGKRPFALISAANKAEEKKRLRLFMGVDLEKAEKLRTAKKMGLKELPENVAFLKEDAMTQMKRFGKESLDVVVASNLFTTSYADYFVQMGYRGAIDRKVAEFMGEAKRVLKKNGRVILIHIKLDAPAIKEIGEEAGFRAHVIPLTDAQAQKSLAPFIRRVSTPEKRLNRRNSRYGAKSGIAPENLRQTVVIFRKAK